MLVGSNAVHFRSDDDVMLAGRLFGSGPTVVILSHMGPTGNDQTEWWPMATCWRGGATGC